MIAKGIITYHILIKENGDRQMNQKLFFLCAIRCASASIVATTLWAVQCKETSIRRPLGLSI